MTLRYVAFAVAAAVTSGDVHAQTYPAQDLHIVSAYPAGSSSDAIARFIARDRPKVGRTIIVENKPGANGNIATEFVARARPDGHDLHPRGERLAANMDLFKEPPVVVATAISPWGRSIVRPSC